MEQMVGSKRKALQPFDDENTILSSGFIKRSLDYTSDIVRVIAKYDGTWTSNKRLRTEQMFYEPLLSGSSFASRQLTTRTSNKEMKIVEEKMERDDDDEDMERDDDDEDMDLMILLNFLMSILGTWYNKKYLMKDFSMSANDVRYQERRC